MQQGVLCSDIYKVLSAPSYGYSITMYSEDGEATISPSKAKWFYVKPAGFMIQAPDTADAELRPEVYLWKSMEIQDELTLQVMERLKTVSNQYGYGFTVYDFSNGNLPKQFSHIAIRDIENSKPEITESFTGSSLRSYFTLPKSRLIVIHSEKIDETIKGARSRNIKELFVEAGGERFRLENTNINAGKALAQHLNAGGKINDRFGNIINMYSSDLNSLKELIAELQIQGRTTQAQNALRYINLIKDYLKHASTPKGYTQCMENIGSLPRVGNKHIDDYAKRIMPMCSSTQNRAYARQLLMDECKKISHYRDVIMDNLDSDIVQQLEPRYITSLAKHICVGAVPVNGDWVLDECDDVVLKYGNSIGKIVDEPYLKSVIENICSKPSMNPRDAELIYALINSVIGHERRAEILDSDVPNEPEILEITELQEWAENI